MKLLRWCVMAAIAAGVTVGSHIASAQALGEAANLSAGVSSAGSGSGSALGKRLNRSLRRAGRPVASSGSKSTSGGVVNLHWSREELRRTARTRRTHAKRSAKIGRKAQQDFVIFGADPEDGDSDGASGTQLKTSQSSANQPKPTQNKSSLGKGGSTRFQ